MLPRTRFSQLSQTISRLPPYYGLLSHRSKEAIQQMRASGNLYVLFFEHHIFSVGIAVVPGTEVPKSKRSSIP